MKKNNKGFTLIEIIVSTTILSIILLSILVIYTNIVSLNKRLELSRILQENSRNIIESLGLEIREKGIDYSTYTTPGFEFLDYSGNGNDHLYIKSSNTNPIIYCMMKKGINNICESSCKTDSKNCFLGKKDSDIKLSDERVEIRNLKFYISGKPNTHITNIDKEGKVTIVFDLMIAKGKGLDSGLIDSNILHLQTTISAKMYKNMHNQ